MILACCRTNVFAQQIQIQAPQVVGVGEQYYVRYIVNDNTSNIQDPKTSNARKLTNAGKSSSTSIQMTNGHIEKSSSTTFTYVYVSEKEGTATFGPATFNINGKQVTSKSFNIKVEKSSPRQQQARQQSQGGWDDWEDPFAAMQQMQQQMMQQITGGLAPQPAQQSKPVAIDGSSLFARASISNPNPYQGEEVIITYKVYTQVSLRQYLIDKLPSNKGFWAEDLTGNRREVEQWEETLNGKRYMVAEIRRGALYAQENGKLKIEPLDLDVLAMVPRQRTGTIWDLFNDPFFNAGQAVEKHLSSNAINVNVKPLPPAPEDFCGAVGSFNITSEIDKDKVRANEAVTYKLTISGKGNLMLINTPELSFPNVFEVYDPQESDNLTRNNAGVSGSKTFEWVLIPRNQGEYEIPETTISFFNPQTGQYVTQTLPRHTISVDQADPRAASSTGAGSLKKKDLNYNKTIHETLTPIDSKTAIGWWFWVCAALMVVGAITTTAILKKKEREPIAGIRQKRSVREAKKRLKKAEKHLHDGNDNRFYEEVYKAIWGCLADKYNIELAKLSSDTVKSCLEEKLVDETKQQRILQTLQDVDMARFAPGDPSSIKHEIYNEAVDMIAFL